MAESWIVRLPGTEDATLPAAVGAASTDVTLGDELASLDTLIESAAGERRPQAVTLVVGSWADLVPHRWASHALAGDETPYTAWLDQMFADDAQTVWNRPDLLLERLVGAVGSAEKVHVVVVEAGRPPSADAAALLQATRSEYAKRGWGQDVFDQYFAATVWPRRQAKGAALGVPEHVVVAAHRLVDALGGADASVTGNLADVDKRGPSGDGVVPRAVSAAAGADVLVATIEATVDPAEVAAGHAVWRRAEELSWRELVALLRKSRTGSVAGERPA
ncbi:hypothetical protein H4N58_04010 [Mumia sp. ZJ1417]|uniref:hypothetical protein n=1 Tax=Mumia sp. ZJ1417 TaxID=2708082 RepID=UPI001420AE78|nr:hypothetical protein [Mumia sp. ZJ1417]QMW67100.1 hypothetical protein H4N58_04010 [Mumia sp. ZJ1417]